MRYNAALAVAGVWEALTQAARQLGPHLHLVQRLRVLQRLRVCVGRPELYALAGVQQTALLKRLAAAVFSSHKQESKPSTEEHACSPLLIMRFTALLPPPPTPITCVACTLIHCRFH